MCLVVHNMSRCLPPPKKKCCKQARLSRKITRNPRVQFFRKQKPPRALSQGAWESGSGNLAVPPQMDNQLWEFHFDQISYLLPHQGWIAARAHTGRIGPIGPPRKINQILAFFILKIFDRQFRFSKTSCCRRWPVCVVVVCANCALV